MMILGPFQLRLASSKFLYRYTSGLSWAFSAENLTEQDEHSTSGIGGEALAESDNERLSRLSCSAALQMSLVTSLTSLQVLSSSCISNISISASADGGPRSRVRARGPSAQPPISTCGIFPVHVSA